MSTLKTRQRREICISCKNKAAVFHNSDNNVCNKNTRYFALSTVNVYRLFVKVCVICLCVRLQSVISRSFLCHLWSLFSSRLLASHFHFQGFETISVKNQCVVFKSASTSVLLMSAVGMRLMAKPQHNIHGFVHHSAGRPQ